jgi:hypothetical protein
MAKVADTAQAKRAQATHEASPGRGQSPEKPVSEKPLLSRYDQVGQGEPYGPSEV